MTSDPTAVPARGTRRHVDLGEIHIFGTTLDGPENEQILSPDERVRAARFHFSRDRKRFVAARTFMRIVLGEYLGIDPADAQFGYTEYGKPFLSDSNVAPALSFNVAHSEDRAMMAVACGRAVGIDLENHRPGFASDRLAEQFFSSDEVQSMRSLPSEEQERAFFDCWTRKEAYIKARGQGLSIPLNGFTVSTSPNDSSALLSTTHDPSASTEWRVCDLKAPAGFSAALAYEIRGTLPKILLVN